MFTVYQASFLAKDELCAVNQWGISQICDMPLVTRKYKI